MVEFRSFGRDRTRVKWGYEVLMGWNFNAIYSGFAILIMLFQLPLTCPTALKGVLPLGLEKWSLVFRVLLFSEYFQFFIGAFLLCRIFLVFFSSCQNTQLYVIQGNCHRSPFLGQCMSSRNLTASYLDRWSNLKGSVSSRFLCQLSVHMLAKGARAFFLLWEVYTKGHKKIHRAFFFSFFLFSPPPQHPDSSENAMCHEWMFVIRNSGLTKLEAYCKEIFTCSGPKSLLGKWPEVWKPVSWK